MSGPMSLTGVLMSKAGVPQSQVGGTRRLGMSNQDRTGIPPTRRGLGYPSLASTGLGYHLIRTGLGHPLVWYRPARTGQGYSLAKTRQDSGIPLPSKDRTGVCPPHPNKDWGTPLGRTGVLPPPRKGYAWTMRCGANFRCSVSVLATPAV